MHLFFAGLISQYLLSACADLYRQGASQEKYIYYFFICMQVLLFFGIILLDLQVGFVINNPRCKTGLMLGVSFFLF